MKESDFSEEALEKLKEAGWYEGRKIDITEYVEYLESLGVEVLDSAKRFLEEFGELNVSLAGEIAFSFDTRKKLIVDFFKCKSKRDINLKIHLERIKEKTSFVGLVDYGDESLYVSETGKLFSQTDYFGNYEIDGLDNFLIGDNNLSIFYYNLKQEVSSVEYSFVRSFLAEIFNLNNWKEFEFGQFRNWLEEEECVQMIKKFGKYASGIRLFNILEDIREETDEYDKVIDEIEACDFMQNALKEKREQEKAISEYGLEKLKEAGWNDDRKIDIAENVIFLEEQGFEVTKNAKLFMEKYGNLNVIGVDSIRSSTNVRDFPNIDHSEIKKHIKERYTFIGAFEQDKIPIYITESGKMFYSGGWLGDTINEGLNNIIAHSVYKIPWSYYESEKYDISNRELSLLVALETKISNDFFLGHRIFSEIYNSSYRRKLKKVIAYLNKPVYDEFKKKLEKEASELPYKKKYVDRLYKVFPRELQKTEEKQKPRLRPPKRKTNFERTEENLEEAFWYKERKIDITENIRFLEEKGFEVTEKAKLFLEEYGELEITAKRVTLEDVYYDEKISTKLEDICDIDVDNSLDEHIKEKYTLVGAIFSDNEKIPFYVTESEKVFTNKGWRGDCILEGLVNIITTEYEAHWFWYDDNNGKFSNTELSFLALLHKKTCRGLLSIGKFYEWLDNETCVRMMKKMGKYLYAETIEELKKILRVIKNEKSEYKPIVNEILPLLKSVQN